MFTTKNYLFRGIDVDVDRWFCPSVHTGSGFEYNSRIALEGTIAIPDHRPLYLDNMNGIVGFYATKTLDGKHWVVFLDDLSETIMMVIVKKGDSLMNPAFHYEFNKAEQYILYSAIKLHNDSFEEEVDRITDDIILDSGIEILQHTIYDIFDECMHNYSIDWCTDEDLVIRLLYNNK
jgi:hypothetical protein